MRFPRSSFARWVLALALVARPAFAAQPLFNSNYLFYPVSGAGSGWNTAAADLDNDGHADLIAPADQPSGNGHLLAVWRGSAQGLRTPPDVTLIGTFIGDVDDEYPKPADVNADGWTDLVLTASDSLYVFPNLQNGSLGTPIRLYVPGGGGGTVAVGDLNGDGHADVALTETVYQSFVQIFLGDGAFGFTQAPLFATHYGGHATEIADFDENGMPDLLIAARDTSQILLGQGGGSFSARDVPGDVIAVADLDLDGHEDLVTTTSVLLGNGDGTFHLPILHGADGACGIADLDADGVPELFGLPTYFLGPVRPLTVSRGLGHGLFGPPQPYNRFADPRGFVVAAGFPVAADFDGDGRVDLSMAAFLGGFSYVMRGLGDSRLETAPWLATGATATAITAGHLDPGATPDLAVVAGQLKTWLQQSGSFVPKDSSAVLSSSMTALGTLDLNEDGLEDIVACYSGLATYSVWLTQPGGALGPRTDHSTPAVGIATLGDVDLDGDIDMVLNKTAVPTGTLIFLNDHSGAFAAHSSVGAFTSRVFIADMNGDGLPDLVGGSPVTGKGLRVQLATVPGVFAAPIDQPGAGAPTVVGRIDSDALPDVITTVSPLGPMSYYRNLGAGSFAAAAALPSSLIVPQAAADLDGDGDLELVRRTSGGATVQFSNGDGTFASPIGFGALSGTDTSPAIFAGDVDGDGHPDLVVGADAFLPNVSILLNTIGKPVLSAPPVAPPIAGRGLALSVRPNPARGRITASLSLGAAVGTLEMYDVRGRRVLRRQLAAGVPSRELDLGDAHAFPPGVYFLVVRSAGASARSRLCVLR